MKHGPIIPECPLTWAAASPSDRAFFARWERKLLHRVEALLEALQLAEFYDNADWQAGARLAVAVQRRALVACWHRFLFANWDRERGR